MWSWSFDTCLPTARTLKAWNVSSTRPNSHCSVIIKKVSTMSDWPQPTKWKSYDGSLGSLIFTVGSFAFLILKQFIIRLEAMLSQVHGEPGKLHLVNMAEEECCHWLEGACQSFIVHTDHRNLEYIQQAKRPGQRFSSCILTSSYCIIPGLRTPRPITVRLPQGAQLCQGSWALFALCGGNHVLSAIVDGLNGAPYDCPPGSTYTPVHFQHRESWRLGYFTGGSAEILVAARNARYNEGSTFPKAPINCLQVN